MSKFIGTRSQLIELYGPFIVEQTKGTGILPGTLITQLIVESQGKRGSQYLVGASTLSKEAQNYFGIKCGSTYKGPKFNIRTREETKTGESYYVTACFRKYSSIEESIKDYIRFLQANKRYANAGFFQQKTVEGQFAALKKAGYATGSGYVQLLTNVYRPLKNQIDNITTTTNANLGPIVPVVMLLAGIYYIWNKL